MASLCHENFVFLQNFLASWLFGILSRLVSWSERMATAPAEGKKQAWSVTKRQKKTKRQKDKKTKRQKDKKTKREDGNSSSRGTKTCFHHSFSRAAPLGGNDDTSIVKVSIGFDIQDFLPHNRQLEEFWVNHQDWITNVFQLWPGEIMQCFTVSWESTKSTIAMISHPHCQYDLSVSKHTILKYIQNIYVFQTCPQGICTVGRKSYWLLFYNFLSAEIFS